jgi:thymidylate kinase
MTGRPLVVEPRVVEFCGLPGSGKTSVATEVCRALRSAGVDARVADLPVSAAAPRPARVARRAGLASWESVTGPAGALRTARQVAWTRPTVRDGAALLAQLLTVRRLAARAVQRPGISLLEEGTVQTLWSLALRAHGPLPDVAGWGGPTSDLVVHVDCPTDVALERLARRPSRHSRTQRLDAAEQAPELEHGRRVLDQLLAAVIQDRLTVLNDGTTPLPDLGQGIAAWVLRAV